jgi:hypothetical protein
MFVDPRKTANKKCPICNCRVNAERHAQADDTAGVLRFVRRQPSGMGLRLKPWKKASSLLFQLPMSLRLRWWSCCAISEPLRGVSCGRQTGSLFTLEGESAAKSLITLERRVNRKPRAQSALSSSDTGVEIAPRTSPRYFCRLYSTTTRSE